MPFVIKLAKPYLQYMSPSLIDYSHPCSLIALILVAVSHVFVLQSLALIASTIQLEHAVRAFEKTGEFEDPGSFNSNYKALLTKYLESMNAFNKWDDFYEECNLGQKPQTYSLAVDMSQTDIGRRALNFSSSPIRG